LSNDNDILAKFWALELNQLVPDQKLFAQKAINDILFEAKLKSLNRNSVQINHQCSRNTLLETPMHTSSNSSWNYSNNTFNKMQIILIEFVILKVNIFSI